ncbi:MAG: thioredoxin family protein [Bacillota bacterium]
MKKILFILLTISTVILSYAFYSDKPQNGKGNKEIKWTNIEKGSKDIKSSNKKMIIDVYTDWCGWCKQMDKSTYGNAEVANYISNNFIAVKLNAESKSQMNYLGESYTEQQIAQGFGITGYPATIFIDENQKPITVVPGYIEGKQFMDILKYIKEDYYKTKSFEEYMQTAKN